MCYIWGSLVHIDMFPGTGSYCGSEHGIWEAEGSPKLKVPSSHRGGVEDDLRVITVIGGHHLARESGQSRGGWRLSHHGGLLGLE